MKMRAISLMVVTLALAAAPAALASEYAVAAVERLDEAPQPKADEGLVASNDTERR